ncbi:MULTISPECIES: T6SS effector BTH_I2691 family protein [Yersinia]|uniref:Toxin VasX N-terminal region domain-containing protein n=1 Tax=Yersinia pekkanenii TaxID=1288385 RepID=A0A0T9R9U2_9GAMM|nr:MULTISPECIES: T6SS effector BTH_I2691 family protein [Yersinia]AJJ05494.1 hypothetical protein BZ20_2920 [Yersinia pseudotuberculosis]MBO1556572.1 hypothetical protein [Yersinia pseudotuberculosis]MBO1561326.1 hypothetical protein [Yersinia pseudotuberculosis]CNI52202.1 Uncharacterised protein [Yersinia pekkanenii]CNK32771.1 Uncharacterised protein [Yersinia pseudotuberculosis]
MGLKDQLRQNAAASQQATCTPSGCKACQRQGLPIFPLRVAAVPKALVSSGWQPTVPQQDIELTGGEFKYALRTLRMGYLYVLLDNSIWQGYQVTAEGYLRQFNPLAMPEGETVAPLSTACLTHGHDIAASFINIDDTKYTLAWLAFSSDPWSETVLAEYKSGQRPASRFTQIVLSELKASPASVPEALALNPSLSALKSHVAEFATNLFSNAEKVAGEPLGGAHGFYPRLKSEMALGLRIAQLGAQYRCQIAALALDDTVGVVQELNNSRMQIAEARQVYSQQPKMLHKNTISQAIEQYLTHLKTAVEDSSQPRYEKAGSYPVWGGTVIPKEQVAEESWAEQYARLLKSYNEPVRAAFAKKYEAQMNGYQQRIEAIGRDLAGWYLARKWLDTIKNDYAPEGRPSCWAAQFNTLTACLQGGSMDTQMDAVWQEWLKQPDSPAYAGLLADQSSLLANVFDGSNGYSYLKTGLGSDEMSRYLESPGVQNAISTRLAALSGAASRVMSTLDEAAQAGYTRMMQGSIYATTGQQITLFKVTTTVEKFQQYVRAASWLPPSVAENHATFGGIYSRGTQAVNTSAAGAMMEITDPVLLRKSMTAYISSPVSLEELKATLKSAGTNPEAIVRTPLKNPNLLNHFSDLRIASTSLRADAGSVVTPLNMPETDEVLKERTRRYASGNGLGMVLSAGMMWLQLRDWNENAKNLEKAIGNDTDASLKYYINRLMVLSAATEIAGFSRMLTIKNNWDVLPKHFVHPLIRTGGVIAGVAAVVDGVRMGMLGWEAYKEGDKEAGSLYYKSAIFTALGGFISGGGAYLGIFTLLGPAGIGALLILTGAMLAFEASQLRSTPFEVWLRRSCFGIPHDNDVVWHEDSLQDLNASLTAFNAIVNGMAVEVGYEGLSELQGIRYTKLELRLSLPGCKETTSAWELRLTGGEANTVLLAETHNVPGKLDHRLAAPTSEYYSGRYKRAAEGNNLEIRAEVWVNESRYGKATLDVNYWPDKTDPQYQLALVVNAEK